MSPKMYAPDEETDISTLRIIYRAADGTEIVLEVPWGLHTGQIPPPIIEFSNRQFAYAGEDDDSLEEDGL